MHSFTVLGYVCLTIPTLVQLYRQLIRTTAVCSGTFPIRKSVKYHRSILVLRSCYLNASIKIDVPNMAVYIFQMETLLLYLSTSYRPICGCSKHTRPFLHSCNTEAISKFLICVIHRPSYIQCKYDC